jgi:hypothetical protein
MTGQPRPADDVRQPSAAERVRTLAESTASAVLSIAGTYPDKQMTGGLGTPAETRAGARDGSVIVLVTADSPAAKAVRAAAAGEDPEITAVLEITDVAPVSVPHRVRGRAWVLGWLTAVPPADREECSRLLGGRVPLAQRGELLVRLETGEAYTDDLWGAAGVEPEEFAAAVPDPLAAHEAELLQHLAGAHQDQLAALCAGLGDRGGRGAGCAGWERVAPLALDRFGIRLRFWQEHGGGFDARFDFHQPVRDICELRRAMHRLFTSAAP